MTLVCTNPQCQTSAGCICDRTLHTPIDEQDPGEMLDAAIKAFVERHGLAQAAGRLQSEALQLAHRIAANPSASTVLRGRES